MSAAIGAAFLLYFGFARLMEPEATDLFSTSNLILYHTARWGGVLMAGVALWLWSGHVVALLADGVVATLIGVLLVITGLGMGVGGGDMFQTLINFFCGYMFYSSGVQNGRDYFRLTKRATNIEASAYRTPPMMDVVPQAVSPGPAVIEPIAPTQKIATFTSEPPAPPPEPVVDADANLDQDHQPDVDPAPSPAPPGGYLASFAKKDPPQDS
jgi:hypothetical protein